MTAPALRVTAANAHVYRRTWHSSLVTAFLSPLLYLVAMGLGLGALIDPRAEQSLDGLSYLEFLAPGLLAATAMQVGAAEGTWPVMLGVKWAKTYHAVLSTPIGPRDLVVGNLVWSAVRLVLASAAFALVMVMIGVTGPVGALSAIPPAVLTGLAFAAALHAYTPAMHKDTAIVAVFRFGIVPLFLFSGTFFPIEQLPAALQPLAVVTPLWHGVELCRAAALGTEPGVPVPVAVAYLSAWVVGGGLVASHTLRRRLIA